MNQIGKKETNSTVTSTYPLKKKVTDFIESFQAITIKGSFISESLLYRIMDQSAQIPEIAWTSFKQTDLTIDPIDYFYKSFSKLKDEFLYLSEQPDKKENTQTWMDSFFTTLGFSFQKWNLPIQEQDGPIQVFKKHHAHKHDLKARVALLELLWNQNFDTPMIIENNVQLDPHTIIQNSVTYYHEFTWGLLFNGNILRLVGSSEALSIITYLEFDLELIFKENLVAEFFILYALLHYSRFYQILKIPIDHFIEKVITGTPSDQKTTIEANLRSELRVQLIEFEKKIQSYSWASQIPVGYKTIIVNNVKKRVNNISTEVIGIIDQEWDGLIHHLGKSPSRLEHIILQGRIEGEYIGKKIRENIRIAFHI